MSVAFRRESDEEHLEPKFELPIPVGPNLVTAAGPALIADRIAQLEARIDGASDVEILEIKRDLRYWTTRRATATVTAAPADGTVGFGVSATIRMAGRERTITLVGDDETDPASDRIAYSAPLARALIGAEVGETVPFNGRDDAIEILAIVPVDR